MAQERVKESILLTGDVIGRQKTTEWSKLSFLGYFSKVSGVIDVKSRYELKPLN